MAFNMQRAMELQLHIAQELSNDPNYGRTKLYKILFAADFQAYGIWGESLTGTEYVRFERGPVPRGFSVENSQAALVKAGRATIEKRDPAPYTRICLIAADDAEVDKSVLLPEQWQLVNNIINEVRHMNAKAISEWSHGFLPWLYTQENAIIPYATTFALRDVPPSTDAIAWARSAIEEIERDRGAGE